MAQARFLRHLLAPLFLLAGILSARATDYYVSPSGLDTQLGTEAAPWLTLQHAADTLTPGDRVLVRSGTYAAVKVNVSGSAAAGPVTFTNYPGESPVIDATGVTPPAGDSALFLIKDHSYVIVSGFELRNYKTTIASRVLAGILITGACSHVEIRNCHVHGIWNTG
ncbi:MAG: Parallel beta-helix repeat protein, partial [Akkermansiaceae bacterium]|nr:Parallel beta-helix repeat protein [Akkermansiaceae bacterium]